jgi:selenocysteine lyase/cysteine desulfurase
MTTVRRPASTGSALAAAAEPQPDIWDGLDSLRASDYFRLDQLGHVYLDYTGAGLYGASQIQQHMALLAGNVFGNPHSSNPTSARATELVEGTRARVLGFFNASSHEYEVIFTLNASGALKLVGESYPFCAGGRYMLTYDNHNSVNGIREFARRKGAAFSYVPIRDPDLVIDEDVLADAIASAKSGTHNLFAYPAQSNFSGVQHSLEWIARAQDHGWDVVLDAAAFAPTNQLDLSAVHPDFVPLSFYKMFGYPTGVGCLLARKEALEKLRRPWFGGGTLVISSVKASKDRGHGFYMSQGREAFEDGTLNYLSIPAVDIGLQHLTNVGVDAIHVRVMALTAQLLDRLKELVHENGHHLVHVYGPLGTDGRGGTITMNFFDPVGTLIPPREVEREATRRKISLRTGCHCNPGAGETALGISEEQMAAFFKPRARRNFDRFLHVVDDMKAGAVRASFGIASNQADVDAFVAFATDFVDRPSSPP